MSRRQLPLGIFSAVVLGLVGMGSAQETDPFGKANPGPMEKKADEPSPFELSTAKAPSEQDLRKALNTPVPVDFRDDPLIDVMKILAKATGTNIVVDEQALTEEGVGVDEGITMKGKPIAAARLLDRMLEPLGLTWVLEDHIVKVTTIIAAEEKLYTVTYPVGDLLEYGKKHQNDETAALESTNLEFVQFGDGGELGPGVGAHGCMSTDLFPGAWLVDVLQQMTKGPWQDIDGTGGTLSLVNNNLVVRQTRKNQEAITKILATVRDFTKGELKPRTVPIRPPHYAVEEDEAVKKALATVVSMKAQDTPLKDFVEFVGAEKLGIPVHIDKQALNEEGVAIDEPINLHLKNLPAASLFQIAFKPLGLCGIVNDGRFLVTTTIAAEERLVAKIHDVRDLVAANHSTTALIDSFQQETSGPWQDVDGTGGKIAAPLKGLLVIRQTDKVHDEVTGILEDFRKQVAEANFPAEKKEPPDPQAVATTFYTLDGTSDVEAIQQAILTLIEPKTWSKNGGEGEILMINNLLVIKTKNETHAKVEEFLKEFQKAFTPAFGGGQMGGMSAFGGEVGGGQGAGGMGGGLGGGQGGGFFRLPPGKAKQPAKPNAI